MNDFNGMINNTHPLRYYQDRLAEIQEKQNALTNKRRLISWARLAVILLLIATVVWLWPSGVKNAFIGLMPFAALFGYLVSISLKLDERIKHLQFLTGINNFEIAALNGQHPENFDGAVYMKELAAGGNDLDIFGPASLYAFINRAYTEQGRNILAAGLSSATSRQEIIQKQQAIAELKAKPEWRQQLEAYSQYSAVTISAQRTIENWISEKQSYFGHTHWKIIRFVVPAVSIGVLFLYLADIITVNLFNMVMLGTLAFALLIGKKVSSEYGHLSRIVNELEAFLFLLQTIESVEFKSPLLVAVRNKLTEKHFSSFRIKQLKQILNRFDYRLNPVVYIPLSIFFLWDLQQIFALEKWKRSQTGLVSQWYHAVGEAEALSSLANLAFNHPHWVFPEISEKWFELEGQDMGHPLIHVSKSVTNDFNIKGTGKFVLLTGSNMAGKSTFLRTLGTNMILAMTGAPVCASFFKVPVVKVMSSMRITDNLEEETSTFYAELKKLKFILEAVERDEHVFLLLDEMLRGTNALDRHKGSVALIRQLISKKAVGIIASHDISLTELAESYPDNISNYHFDSVVVKDEIVFDYKLKPGICQSTNATLLMKKIGIALE